MVISWVIISLNPSMIPPLHDVFSGGRVDDLAADVGRDPDLVDLHFTRGVDFDFRPVPAAEKPADDSRVPAIRRWCV
jgi:hypothetical protein